MDPKLRTWSSVSIDETVSSFRTRHTNATDVLREAVLHLPHSNYAFPIDDGILRLRLRCAQNNVESVVVVYGDPYQFEGSKWICRSKEMEFADSDGMFEYWTVDIEPPFRRVRYGFELYLSSPRKRSHSEMDALEDTADSQSESVGAFVSYMENGFSTKHISQLGIDSLFCCPYLHPVANVEPPMWAAETVWYQIFVERFCNGDPPRSSEDCEPWGGTPTRNNFFGGDLEGIIKHIDYLANELGVNGIYLTPIFRSPTNHRYDTTDYFEIEPAFGDREVLRRLVSKCHDKGIRVMLDAVFNHSGYLFAPFQDVLRKGNKSRYKDWFHMSFDGDGKPLTYDQFAFEQHMPKLNMRNPETREYFMRVGEEYVRDFEIDGWRLDVANEVDMDFWKEFRHRIHRIRPSCFILGEVWHNALDWLRGDCFDGVMNYPFRSLLLQYFAQRTLTTTEFQNGVTRLIAGYPSAAYASCMNLLGSHDTARILTESSENYARATLAFFALLTFPGSPCIYYGDEVGMTGASDPLCRGCMLWDGEAPKIGNQQAKTMFDVIKRLLKLRKAFKSYSGRERDLFPRFFDDFGSDVLVYGQGNVHGVFVSIVNNSDRTVSLKAPTILRISNDMIFTHGVRKLKNELVLDPMSCAILRHKQAATTTK